MQAGQWPSASPLSIMSLSSPGSQFSAPPLAASPLPPPAGQWPSAPPPVSQWPSPPVRPPPPAGQRPSTPPPPAVSPPPSAGQWYSASPPPSVCPPLPAPPVMRPTSPTPLYGHNCIIC